MIKPTFEVTPVGDNEFEIEPKCKTRLKGAESVGVFIESFTGALELISKDNEQDE